MKFERMWAGRYKSDDGRFLIERWYDTCWKLIDTYENQDENQKEYRKKTLSECKKLAEKIASETKQPKHENLKEEESEKETLHENEKRKKEKLGLSLGKVKADMFDALNFSCKPTTKIVARGTIIDEEKSVRWNREEVERRRMAYEDEVKRLNTEKNKRIENAKKEVIDYIAQQGLEEEKAKLLFDFLMGMYRDWETVFSWLNHYIDFSIKMVG